MKSSTFTGLAGLAGIASAEVAAWYQCGGNDFSGETKCTEGYTCQYWNEWYSQCIPITEITTSTATSIPVSVACQTSPVVLSRTVTATTFITLTSSRAASASASFAPHTYASHSTVPSLSTLVVASSATSSHAQSASHSAVSSLSISSAIYVASSIASSVTTPVATSVVTSSTSHSTSHSTTPSSLTSKLVSSATSSTTTSPSSSSAASGKAKFAGVNIAGFDFGCDTSGDCVTSSTYDIVANGNGIAQMDHFISDTGLNAFRLPVGWQYLTNTVVGGDLDATNAGEYDKLVQGCLDSGAALCIIDIHNYARWNGQIIGQGGPTNAQFAALWTSLATKYASESKIAFGIMNEPHDLSSIDTWAETVQAVVTAIREAGATSQYILLPGTDYTSAASFIDNGSGAALMTVTNPDGTTDKLIFDVHKYLDSDGSGTSTECVTNNIDSAFSPLATWLRSNGRMAFTSETGGGNTASCVQYLREELDYINENSDVYLGYTAWAAGGFDTSYALSETPTLSGSTWTDMEIVTQCVAASWLA